MTGRKNISHKNARRRNEDAIDKQESNKQERQALRDLIVEALTMADTLDLAMTAVRLSEALDTLNAAEGLDPA